VIHYQITYSAKGKDQLSPVTVWVDTQTQLPVKWEATGVSKIVGPCTVRYTFTDWQINAPLDDKLFDVSNP